MGYIWKRSELMGKGWNLRGFGKEIWEGFDGWILLGMSDLLVGGRLKVLEFDEWFVLNVVGIDRCLMVLGSSC